MIRKSIAALCALLLAGCATVETPQLAGQRVSGRLSIKHEQGLDRVNFSWTQGAGLDQVAFDSPLGQTLALLSVEYAPDGQVRRASLQRGGEPELQAENPDALLFELTGLAVPVSGLRWWLQGKPQPGEAFEAWQDEAGRQQLRQSGWQISSWDYRALPAAVDQRYPYRLEAVRDGVLLKVVVDEVAQEGGVEHVGQ